MNRTFHFQAFCLTTLALTACNGNDHRFETARQSAATIQGEWKIECIKDPRHATYSSMDLSFDGEKYSYEATIYADEGCKTATLRNKVSGTFSLGESADPKTAARTMDLKADQVFLTYFGADNVDRANGPDANHCGYSDWKDGVARDITDNESCRKDTAGSSSVTYTVIKLVDNDQLYFGQLTADQDGSSAEKRETSLDDEHALKRVK